MDSKEMFRKALDGSNNIDRMEQEINSFVGMMLKLAYLPRDCAPHVFQSKETGLYPMVEWRVGSFGHHGERVAECYLFFGGALSSEMLIAYSSATKKMDHWKVKEIYESLPILLDGLRKTFKQFDRNLKPFLDAADVFQR